MPTIRALAGRALCLPLLFAAGHVLAANQSAYTRIEDEKCRLVAENEAGATMVCEGYAGIWYEINDGDARVSVTFGVDQDVRTGRRRFESFQNFKTINDVIEWRHRGDGQPFSAILRWFISIADDGGATSATAQVMVVSKIGDAL